MGGPKPQRLDPNLTAPDPSLRGPSSNLLQGFLQNPGSLGNSIFGGEGGFAQFLQSLQQPGSAQQAFNTALPGLQAQLTGDPGADILKAATPIFNRNLQQGADTLRQAGPRFASNTERLVGQQGQQAMQDFNLFSQNVMESGRNRQIAAAGMLGQLGQGADQSTLGFQQNQLRGNEAMFGVLGPLLQQFFGTAFAGGGLTQPGTVTQAQPWWQQALGAAGQVANIVGAVKGGKTFDNPYGGGPTPTGSPAGVAPFIQQGGPANPAWFGLPSPGAFRLP